MRIIAGQFGGRNLESFNGKDIRPTSDKAREAIFSILQNKLVGCDFMDLFAGTGGVGFEAISRGAGNVVFSDSSSKACEIIKKNAENLKVDCEVHNIPAMYVLNRLISLKRKFDIFFLDPPYDTTFGEEALEIIFKNDLLKEGGIVILEKGCSSKNDFKIDEAIMYDKRKYGIAVFRFYKKKEALK